MGDTNSNSSADKTSSLARIRNNQRRSRARRKEYLHELESKWRACEKFGIEASAEIQAAARKVVDENRKLRALLLRYGISEVEIEDSIMGAAREKERDSDSSREGEREMEVSPDAEISFPFPSSSSSSSPVVASLDSMLRNNTKRACGGGRCENGNGNPSSSTRASTATASPSPCFPDPNLRISVPNQIPRPKPPPSLSSSSISQSPGPSSSSYHSPLITGTGIYTIPPHHPTTTRNTSYAQTQTSHSHTPILLPANMWSSAPLSENLNARSYDTSANLYNSYDVHLPTSTSTSVSISYHQNPTTTTNASSCRAVADAIRYIRPGIGGELETEMGCEDGADCDISTSHAFDLMDRFSDDALSSAHAHVHVLRQ